MSDIVRENLLTVPNYTPYCGKGYYECGYRLPRLKFDGEQFKCFCGYRTNFEAEFIQEYKKAQEGLKKGIDS